MPDEGVYTLQGRETSLDTYVLGFELKDEADRFATLLEAQGFGMACRTRCCGRLSS